MSSLSEKATNTLSNIPFEDIIGGPLTACINAQADAAAATVQFIQSVGFKTKGEGENMELETVNVSFSYTRKNSTGIDESISVKVPLLTIVPIPYLAITNVQIDFKAKVSGIEKSGYVYESSKTQTENTESSKKTGLGIFYKKTTKMNTSLSSKKDSRSTRDSSFSVESTIDVSVTAGQESMPAGMLKILEILSNAVEVSNKSASGANS